MSFFSNSRQKSHNGVMKNSQDIEGSRRLGQVMASSVGKGQNTLIPDFAWFWPPLLAIHFWKGD